MGKILETKNVYSSLKAIFVSLAFASFGICSNLYSKDNTLLICGAMFVIWTIFLVFLRFRPFFSYNDRYLIRTDLRKGLNGSEKIRWQDINSIITYEYPGITFIKPKSGNLVPIGFLITPNYYQVLKEIVDLLQKNNPNAVISSATLKMFEKGYKQKQIILFILFLLLLVLVWALARFRWLAIS